MLVTSRSARTLRSMAELVSAAVERRARVHAGFQAHIKVVTRIQSFDMGF
jgi:hypothetical protein